MSAFSYMIFFTGVNNPRHGCTVIGWQDAVPLFFEFETDSSCTTVGTIISRDRQPVAALHWGIGPGLGQANISGMEVSIDDLIRPGSTANGRSFVSANGSTFEWRRSYQDPASYELWAGPNAQIAGFRMFTCETPVGLSHATLEYNFTDPAFLLEALVTLCVNRSIDLNMAV
ncbi:hypothetical protein SCLCIDRAFT_126583 [Scleroderma citrinum Foug A]|uniref:DUF6593 domain-containing protein n=1 Tax=Scleroderma citrinum Foug A TaxID=1036808 RepID=A0A0C3DSP4_9AGAM|nr:hypothetical protein SCLCIDRAFT_126583 [Scleroderma citrinum Foug A]